MSGIYGIVRFDGLPVTRGILAPMATAMSFWGPDGHGQWCSDSAGLGHLMLHVTPESLHERLPASIRVAPHLVITADARIDNREEILDQLGVPTAGRDETPDSSLILLAYERWGPDCVGRLLGDFAFAIWDSRERRMFCARDPFGCMPFLYHFDGKRFIFASDVNGVLPLVESPRLNEPLLAAYLQMHTYHAEKTLTFFEGIVKLPPAHVLVLTAAGVKLSRYWSPEDAPEVRLATDADYAERMRMLFQQSVECRLRSAFPIGSHLSGGLDSSSISVVAARALRARGETLEVFSWSPPPVLAEESGPDNEHVRIEAVCRAEGLTCRYLPFTEQDFIELFQKDFTVDPAGRQSREWKVQADAENRGLRVMLSGWGGDELVSGRPRSALAEFAAGGQWREFCSVARARLNTARGGSALWNALLCARRLGSIFLDVAVPRLPDFLYPLFHSKMWLEHESSCIQPAFARLHRQAVRDLRGPAFRLRTSVRSTASYYLDCGHIPMRLEHWATGGARYRLVYRYPLLDRRLVEFAMGVPAAQLCNLGHRPALFLRAVSALLPKVCDWDRRKGENIGTAAIKSIIFAAHENWASHVIANLGGSPACRFVDPLKIGNAIRTKGRSGRIGAILGIREAFGCYALGSDRQP